MEVMDFRKILFVIAKAAQKEETVEIYYPKTERGKAGWPARIATRSVAGWREIEPYSLATDVAPEGEHLVWGEDLLSPGHILNAYTVGSRNKTCHSFIIGKIKQARLTGKKFTPRNNWKIEF